MKNVTENGDFVPEEQEINLGPAVRKQIMPVEHTGLVVVSGH